MNTKLYGFVQGSDASLSSLIKHYEDQLQYIYKSLQHRAVVDKARIPLNNELNNEGYHHQVTGTIEESTPVKHSYVGYDDVFNSLEFVLCRTS